MYQLRPYQQQAVDSTLNYFRKQRSPAVLCCRRGPEKVW